MEIEVQTSMLFRPIQCTLICSRQTASVASNGTGNLNYAQQWGRCFVQLHSTALRKTEAAGKMSVKLYSSKICKMKIFKNYILFNWKEFCWYIYLWKQWWARFCWKGAALPLLGQKWSGAPASNFTKERRSRSISKEAPLLQSLIS